MLFPTFDYFVFLPLVAAIHVALKDNGWRTGWLMVASLAFYAAWNPSDTLLLGFVIVAAWASARRMEDTPADRRGPVAWGAAAAILAPLIFYKYTPFVGENLHAWIPAIPAPPRHRLPIGVSFYSFQALAYVLDVRRGEKAERNFVRFATFLLFFPHLVAGPILRSSTLLAQLAAPRIVTATDVGAGVARLCVGLVKKRLIADVLAAGVVDSVFTDPDRFTGLEILVALYAYTMQIYADFSGYTDFAIGSARLFGFRIPENFDRPYQALSVGNYWRRWHITLSDWVRDYVYYPMGGSRSHAYRNTFITLLILGIWHGANWTFVVYGLLHGCAVSINRWTRRRRGHDIIPTGLGAAWRWALTFHFVVLARILFRADDLAHAWKVASSLANWSWVMPRYALQVWVVLAASYAVHLSPRAWMVVARDRFVGLPAPAQGVLLAAVAALCIRFGAGDALAFIYYDF
jgi:D-alanyl-lipoteichoic acid acyltransferase DltB (MBOAT superfamily)